MLLVLTLAASALATTPTPQPEAPPPPVEAAKPGGKKGKKGGKHGKKGGKKGGKGNALAPIYSRHTVMVSVRPQMLRGMLPVNFEDDGSDTPVVEEKAAGWMRGAAVGLHFPQIMPDTGALGVQLEYLGGGLDGAVRDPYGDVDELGYAFEQFSLGAGLAAAGKPASMRKRKSPTLFHADLHLGATWGSRVTTQSGPGTTVEKEFLGPRLDWSLGAA